MSELGKIITEGGVPIWSILFLGAFAVGLIAERAKVFYFQYNLDANKFMEKIKGFIVSDQLDEAIRHAEAHKKAPVAHVTKSVLARANRDDEAIQYALDISLSETIPNVGKRLGYLSMISNVVTLIGLLGTIFGLIMSFKAVSFADPSQKQTLLAQGISMSMNTTAFGLAVAIPVMMIYSFLHAKQSQIIEELTLSASKLVDLLAARNYRGFHTEDVFPTDVKTEKFSENAPEPPKRAS